MPKLRPRHRSELATYERPCPRCAAPIRIGDLTTQMSLETGRRVWVHNDCRGRIELHLGLNDRAYTPSPKDWNGPPECPECGAFMTRSEGGAFCPLSERHESGEVVRITTQGWRK